MLVVALGCPYPRLPRPILSPSQQDLPMATVRRWSLIFETASFRRIELLSSTLKRQPNSLLQKAAVYCTCMLHSGGPLQNSCSHHAPGAPDQTIVSLAKRGTHQHCAPLLEFRHDRRVVRRQVALQTPGCRGCRNPFSAYVVFHGEGHSQQWQRQGLLASFRNLMRHDVYQVTRSYEKASCQTSTTPSIYCTLRWTFWLYMYPVSVKCSACGQPTV